MDNALDHMFDSDSSDSSEDNIVEDDDYDGALANAIQAMLVLAAPNINIPIRHLMVEPTDFDIQNNVLYGDAREAFKTECVYPETHLFTQPVSTTNTMEGYMSNVSFHERDLIEELLPDQEIVMYRCNYGKLMYPGYSEPVKIRKTNRGRKKKEKKKKPRKKQGNGDDFNSQVTFVVRSTLLDEPEDYDEEGNAIVSPDDKVYKFKVFRTGKVQLPGVRQHLIEDVICCAEKISQTLNFHLHPGECDPSRMTNIIHLNPVMKNYKFVLKLPPGHIIDMEGLRVVLNRERFLRPELLDAPGPEVAPEHPPIFMLKYTRQDTKLSIKFSTPIYQKPKKRTRINIFMRGKINILGAFDIKKTTQICNYLHWIFEMNPDLIVSEGFKQVAEVEPIWEENIAEMTDDEYVDMLSQQTMELPEISDTDYLEILEFITAVYDKKLAEANEFVADYFAGTEFENYLSEPLSVY